MSGMEVLARHKRSTTALVLALALVGYAWLLIGNIAYVAGGSDSSGYLNSAKQLAGGHVVVRTSALDRLALESGFNNLFIPLGYLAGPRQGTQVPYYPPGLPIQMAAAGLLFGWQTGPFFISPLAALSALAVIFLIARELGLPGPYAALAAAILAAWPIFNFIAVQPLSDVVATLWGMVAVLAALRCRRGDSWAYLCGVALAVSVCVRPASLLVSPALIVALPRSRAVYLRVMAGGAPFAVMLFAYNHVAFGDFLTTGYSVNLGSDLSWRQFLPRFQFYVYWLAITLSPLVLAGWLALPWLARIPGRHRALLVAWFLPFLVMYSFYRHYEPWTYMRFLLPGVPALILGASMVAHHAFEGRARPLRMIGFALLLVGALPWAAIQTHRLDVFSVDEAEAVYVEGVELAETIIPEKSLVVSMQMSGALKYYTDFTIVRWDRFGGRSYETLRAHTDRIGYRWYALLFPWEADLAQSGLPGDWQHIAGAGHVRLWLLPPPDEQDPVRRPGGRGHGGGDS